MLAKNLPKAEKWWKIPFRMALDQISALKGLISGDAGYFFAIISAHIAFLDWLFFAKKKNTIKRKRLVQLKGLYKGNVVWQHFVKKKNRFSEIINTEE